MSSNRTDENKEGTRLANHDLDITDSPNRSYDSSSDDLRLDLVGMRICQVMVPVILCSFYVVSLIRILESTVVKSEAIKNVWAQLGVGSEAKEDSFMTVLVNNILISLGIILLIVFMTLVMLFIFYMAWHRFLIYYFYVPSLVIMLIVTPIMLRAVLESYNLAFDWINLALLTWNFTFFGMASIFGVLLTAPLYAQQLYLIHNSALSAIVIIQVLPSWVPWLILVVLVFWDLFAVLAPFGPLNLLINLAEKEGVIDMPGLIYSTDANANGTDQESPPSNNEQPVKDDSSSKHKRKIRKRTKEHRKEVQTIESDDGSDFGGLQDSEDAKTVAGRNELDTENTRSASPEVRIRRSMEDKGVSIGLGDFVFYSLLIGLTVKDPKMNNYYVTLAALNGILFGLIVTLVFLAKSKRALPALPVSIILALILAALTAYLVPNFSNLLAAEQVFV